jgi:hypothetical protein
MRHLAAALLFCAAALPAAADTSFIRPNLFTASTEEDVTAYASFTENFSSPSVGVKSEAWTVIGPDGKPGAFDRIEPLSQVTVLEEKLPGDGTFRLSTGERLGRSGPQVFTDGQWIPFAPGREIPPGTPTRQSQTATVADVYITKGAPTRAPVDVRIGALELKPETHPSDVYLDSGFHFHVLLNGKPVANQEVTVWREGGAYDEPAFKLTLKSAADGAVHAKFDKPGVYLIWTRMSAEAPAGAATPIRSYTTSLTFEVQR